MRGKWQPPCCVDVVESSFIREPQARMRRYVAQRRVGYEGVLSFLLTIPADRHRTTHLHAGNLTKHLQRNSVIYSSYDVNAGGPESHRLIICGPHKGPRFSLPRRPLLMTPVSPVFPRQPYCVSADVVARRWLSEMSHIEDHDSSRSHWNDGQEFNVMLQTTATLKLAIPEWELPGHLSRLHLCCTTGYCHGGGGGKTNSTSVHDTDGCNMLVSISPTDMAYDAIAPAGCRREHANLPLPAWQASRYVQQGPGCIQHDAT